MDKLISLGAERRMHKKFTHENPTLLTVHLAHQENQASAYSSKGQHPKEKTGFFGNFSQMSDPPLLLGTCVFKKKVWFILHLRSIFGLYKNVHFLVNFTFGNR